MTGKTMKKIFIFLLLLCCTPLMSKEKPISLRDKFAQAQPGDFVVTSQQGNYSLLCMRSYTERSFLFEEISAPSAHIDLKKTDWKKWVAEKAPGHTSWNLYEIHKNTGELLSCFSYTKNGWVTLSASEQFLPRLLTLPLVPVPIAERKKIGPKPIAGETDHRAPWTPPLILEGKKVTKPTFEIFKGRWPNDGSLLSLCVIELYFAKAPDALAFPCWLEVQSSHYTFKMRTIDAGHNLLSPMPLK